MATHQTLPVKTPKRRVLSRGGMIEVNAMLKEKIDLNLLPVLLFAVLVIYLLFSDPSKIGPF